jgi:hypothetical protein
MPKTTSEFIRIWENILNSHRSWLSQYDHPTTKQWEGLLNNQPESATCEALVRYYLASMVDSIEPNNPPGPDFCCTVGNTRFYVEVTCLTCDKVSRHSGLTDLADDACSYEALTDQIMGEAIGKVRQCSNLDRPCLLAIATLHFAGGQLCFDEVEVEELLTGSPMITRKINRHTSMVDGPIYESTDLNNSAFIRLSKECPSDIEHARTCFSGIVLCDFGSRLPRFFGVLHPQPKHPFNPSLLPTIPFCRIKDGYRKGTMQVEWINR